MELKDSLDIQCAMLMGWQWYVFDNKAGPRHNTLEPPGEKRTKYRKLGRIDGLAEHTFRIPEYSLYLGPAFLLVDWLQKNKELYLLLDSKPRTVSNPRTPEDGVWWKADFNDETGNCKGSAIAADAPTAIARAFINTMEKK